jgi:thioredoxin 1
MTPVLHAIARDFKVCKVNTDSNPQLAAKFQVSGIPLLLIFRNGQIAQRFEGVTDEATLRAALTDHSR